MNRQQPGTFLSAFACAFILVFCCFSQTPNLIEISPAREATCEDISARIDHLLIEVNEKGGQGYAVVYGGSNKIENVYVANYVRKAKAFRKIPDSILQILTAQGVGKPKLELWIGKNGAKPVVAQTNFDFVLAAVPEPIPVTGELFELAKLDGKTTYISLGCEACCIESLDWYLLSQFLDSNPNMKAYLVIRGRNAQRAAVVERLLRKEADAAEVSTKFLKFLYGGKNKTNDNRYFEVSVFLSSFREHSATAFPSLVDGAW